jgi:hypothetical protein
VRSAHGYKGEGPASPDLLEGVQSLSRVGSVGSVSLVNHLPYRRDRSKIPPRVIL